jgi:protein-L-isoaspartate(D-aspartate) O-methyltransferase
MRSAAAISVVLLLAGGCAKREHIDPGDTFGAFSERQSEREALVARMREQGITSERVLAAMRRVPRHAFVPEQERARSYSNHPLPIGHGQTISQPQVVAAMTEIADPQHGDKCLEIGTGSGYQAAILAEVCGKVYSIEYLEPLARFAETNLRGLGYGPDRVALRTGDGYRGWPEAAPFDVVLVTAAPDHVPQPLLDQLAMAGRLVIPVGPNDGSQRLELWVRRSMGEDDAFTRKTLMPVRFVPFLGDAQAAGQPR